VLQNSLAERMLSSKTKRPWESGRLERNVKKRKDDMAAILDRHQVGNLSTTSATLW
jgi:hypothetical protein